MRIGMVLYPLISVPERPMKALRPTFVTFRHYATRLQARFDTALAWLGAQYDEQITG
jgi:hypothetical protein